MQTTFALKIIFAALLFFSLSSLDAAGQTAPDSSNSYAVLRIDYCSNWITTSFGNNKITQERLQRSKQLPINEQVGTINNILADALNKLSREGYKVVTSTSDVNNGSTCGLTYILYKDPEIK